MSPAPTSTAPPLSSWIAVVATGPGRCVVRDIATVPMAQAIPAPATTNVQLEPGATTLRTVATPVKPSSNRTVLPTVGRAPSRQLPVPAATATWRPVSLRSAAGRHRTGTRPAARNASPDPDSGGSVRAITSIAGNDEPQHSHSPTRANARTIRVLLALREQGSFTRAGRALGRTVVERAAAVLAELQAIERFAADVRAPGLRWVRCPARWCGSCRRCSRGCAGIGREVPCSPSKATTTS
ncbi:hypothetical protein GCM10022222_18830 [Amycolatopsis ultiminotia]|uniref:Regulatory helix-turn-helix protein, lysR family n=1 Tax=Amycolatopsis ultiminotia TaxID=543629 RepID=A0ABP6VIE3_9PSEU